jgi:fatty acid CoA ligase FadD9
MPDEAVLADLGQPGLPLQRIIQITLDGYTERSALGERAYDVVPDPATGRHRRKYLARFETITYYELHNRVKAMANAWRHHDAHRVNPGDFVCIIGFAGVDYTTVDLACVYAQAIVVPLQSSLAGIDLDEILADTTPVTLAATMDDLLLAAELAGRHGSVRSIIAFDYDEHVSDDREQLAAARTELAQFRSGAQLITLDELIAFGDFQPWEFLPAENRDEQMTLLLHSSGSTGKPKGAIITERVAKFQFDTVPIPLPVIRLIFAPMNHFMARAQVFSTLSRGGATYFTARPDMSTLFEDFPLVRPTESAMFPRVMEMIHRHFLGEVARRVASGHSDAVKARADVLAEMGETFLGDRISLITTGAAPTTPEIRQFMQTCFRVLLVDGYGCTEAGGGVTRNDRVRRPPVINYRLRDVPELGYYTTDKPYPRGELAVKTTTMVPGYFRRPEATAALFDEDGFLLTGDIMEERAPDHLLYIDRRNDVLKLAQGEFVAVGNLGTMFENGSDLIYQIYVYGNSARSYLLAVVVPNMDIARSRLGRDPDQAELRTLLRSELKRVAEAENLKAFEVPRDFIIEFEPFTHENGLLSSVHKRMRPNLARKYGPTLEQMYVDIERRQDEELIRLRDSNSDLSVLDKIGKALEAVLGVQDIDVNQAANFTELGGDSLGATGFATLLQDIFGVSVPVNMLLSPAGSPALWARTIEAEWSQGGFARPTFGKIHGPGARQLDATDLDIANVLGRDSLDRASMAEPAAQSRTVLVTGATGFLGRFLCLEWLERVAATGGKVVCLVRAADHDAATRRLAEAFSADPELLAQYRQLSEGRLEVVVGDVSEPRLGLGSADFDRLADEVDRIVHPAALVNHMLGYEYLFEPNVVGTAELIGLALSRRQKRFDFVSSLAATSLVDRSAGNDEDSPLRQKITLGPDYGSGYGASKWAAELVLHSAHRRFGLPVNVFRGDMMLPHRRSVAQLNVPDIFVRLLFSIVMTGLAPESFYERAPDGSRPRAHYDGLPVDFIATALVGISLEPHRDIRTFHVINHHDDGISLDTIVDWIEGAGYRIERVGSHRDWLQRFEERMRALPPEQRQHSSLTVLDSLRKPYKFGEAIAGSKRFQEAVCQLPTEREIPHLYPEFIAKCLDDMHRLDLIPAPEPSRS